MKNKFFIIISALFAIAIMNAGANAATTACNPTINLINQDPSPAIPNDYVKVVLDISGLENANCNGFSVKLVPEYPFSLDPGYDSVQTMDGNTFISDNSQSWLVPYRIRVADDALEGDYNLKLLYHQGNSKDFTSLTSLYSTQDFKITITDMQTNFDVVVQEASGNQLSLGIVNTGKNTANSLVVKIPQQDNFMAAGTSEQIVGNLAAGDYSIVSFSIAPSTSRNMPQSRNFSQARAGNFTFSGSSPTSLKVQLDYTDGIGKRRNVTEDIQIGNSLFRATNSTVRNIQGQAASKPGISVAGYIFLIIMVASGIIFYRKSGKKHSKKSSGIPEWVSAERHRKK